MLGTGISTISGSADTASTGSSAPRYGRLCNLFSFGLTNHGALIALVLGLSAIEARSDHGDSHLVAKVSSIVAPKMMLASGCTAPEPTLPRRRSRAVPDPMLPEPKAARVSALDGCLKKWR